jgi:hypothetical protein
MREDMFKVIVERPRWGSRARARNHAIDLGEEASAHESTAQRHRDRFKNLNENLAPLKRWLEGQVDRPWDKVYSELSARIDRRNTVQAHVLQHLEDFVAIRVIEIDGELFIARDGAPQPLVDRWRAWRLYVDPRTGILRRNRHYDRFMRERREQNRHRWDAVCPHPMRLVSATLQLHQLGGLWFAVEVRKIPPAPRANGKATGPLDVLRRRDAWTCPLWHDEGTLPSNRSLYGRTDLYAVAKRQLDRNELRRHGLANDNA